MALQVWLPLNGNINNQGLSGITMTGSPNSWGSNGKIGKCAIFTGNTSNVIYNNTTDFNYTDNFSYCMWINHNYTDSAVQWAFTNGRADYGGYGYGIQIASASDIRCWFGNRIISISCPANEWHHIAFTISGTTIKVYKDGLLYSTNTTATLPTYSDGNGLGIGCFHFTSNIYPYYGSLNDFRIYDHCLSAKEVSEIAKGLVLHYPLNGGEGGINLFKGTKEYYANASGKTTSGINLLYDTSILPLNDLIGKTITFTFDYSIEGDKLNTSGSWQVMRFGAHLTFQYVNSDGISSIAYPCTQYLEHTGTGRAVQIYTIPSTWQSIKSFDISAGAYNQPAENNTNTWYMKNFKVELGNIDTGYSINPNTLGETPQIYDCSGFGNNGIKSGAIACESDSPRYMISYKFNGNSCIKNNQFYFESPIWTVSLWYKYNTAPTAYEGLICLSKNDGSDSNKKIAIMANSSQIWFKTENISISIPSLKVGEWCHLAAVSDGTSAIIYENGVRKASTTISSFVTNAYDLVVGARSSSAGATTTSVYSKGNISDVRIYATALSADDIKQLYNTPISVDKTGNLYAYEFKEG